jgi:galactokinase
VVGARIVGAGLGGCIIVLVEKAHASDVIAAMELQYYKPRNLEPAARVCFPTGGAAVIELGA